MNEVNSVTEIEENLELFEDYLCEGSEDEQAFCHSLIQKGHCFVAYKIEDQLRFSPSRYIGYKNNTIETHKMRKKDGRDTNVAINKILHYSLSKSDDLEYEYFKFCKSLGIEPDNNKRKYWLLNINRNDFVKNSLSVEEFPEGKIVERIHKARERNSSLVAEAKNLFKKKHEHLFCEACGFDFKKFYGKRGEDYIEAHHIIPISKMSPRQKTKVEDIVLVCSNCHRMLHRIRPWLSIEQLKLLIRKSQSSF